MAPCSHLQELPKCCFLRNKKNIGYVKAVNRGIQNRLKMNECYIWIFNNNVVVEEGSLKRLIDVV